MLKMVGNTMIHVSFGEGKIVKWNEQTFSVDFGNLGIKHFDRVQSTKYFPEALLNAYEQLNRARNAIKKIENQFLCGEISYIEYVAKIQEVSKCTEIVGPNEIDASRKVLKISRYVRDGVVQESVINESPEYILKTAKVWKSIFEERDNLVENAILNLFPQMSACQRLEYWSTLNSVDEKVKTLFGAAKNGIKTKDPFIVPEGENEAIKLLAQLLSCNDVHQSQMLFSKFHEALQSEIVEQGWDLQQNLNYQVFLFVLLQSF